MGDGSAARWSELRWACPVCRGPLRFEGRAPANQAASNGMARPRGGALRQAPPLADHGPSARGDRTVANVPGAAPIGAPIARGDVAAMELGGACPGPIGACERCDRVFPRRHGIWRCLPEDRASAHAAFLRRYGVVRRHEGWARDDPGYVRGLPYVSPRDPQAAIWRQRAKTYELLRERVLGPAARARGTSLRVLDLGAGNGWLSARLAAAGHGAVAVDISDHELDGLGAWSRFADAPSPDSCPFIPVQAEFDRVPFDDDQFDVVVFNASLHYARAFEATLAEARRVLAPHGRVVVMDTPVYRDAESGDRMVRERDERFGRLLRSGGEGRTAVRTQAAGAAVPEDDGERGSRGGGPPRPPARLFESARASHPATRAGAEARPHEAVAAIGTTARPPSTTPSEYPPDRHESYLTYVRLRALEASLGWRATVVEPASLVRSAVRRLRSRRRLGREAATFPLIVLRPRRAPDVSIGHSPRLRALWRLMLHWRFRLFQRHRHGRLVLERAAGYPLVVLPHVFNPALLRTGDYLASTLAAAVVPEGAVVLDMGTGSGIGAVAAARWASRVVAVDVSPEAVRCATINALLNRVERKVEVRRGDLFEPVAGERFDLVLFNPPYYRGTPRDLLDRAWRSADVVERFASGLHAHLAPGGSALVVLSSDGERADFLRAFEAAGLGAEPIAVRDLVNETLAVYRLRPSHVPGGGAG